MDKKLKLLGAQSRQLIKFLSNYEAPNEQSGNASMCTQTFSESSLYLDFEKIYASIGDLDDFNENAYEHLDDLALSPQSTLREFQLKNAASCTNCFLIDSGLYNKLVEIYQENEMIQQQEMRGRLQQRNSSDKITSLAGLETVEGVEMKNGVLGEPGATNKTKAEVINTQTGIKYIAPMRGGHVSQMGRREQAGSSNNQASSKCLITNKITHY